MHAGIAQPTGDGNLLGGALDALAAGIARTQGIGVAFLLELCHELVGDDAAGDIATAHQGRGGLGEHENVSDHGHVITAFGNVEELLLHLARVETELLDDESRAADELLLQLEVLRDALAFTVLVWIDDGTGKEMRGSLAHVAITTVVDETLVHGAHEAQGIGGIEVEIRATRALEAGAW